MSNYLSLRQQRNSIASDIPWQFPDIYRHSHPEFVNFVKAYYDAIEDTQEVKFRNASQYRNVDTTLSYFLDSFRNKHLIDFPAVDDESTKFIIKHISDLYKRKGTEESIRMLFRLFYQEEIEVSYPGKSLFKTSDSIYKTFNYVEMKPVNTVDDYPITPGNYIKGDVSKAQAYVDSVIFKNFQGAIVPIVYISNLTGGKFLKDDSLTLEKFDGTQVIVGRLIQGSISSVEVLPGGRTDENKEGDSFDVVSETGGTVGRVIATKIEELETGSIDFDIVDEGYGYTYLEANKISSALGTATLDTSDGKHTNSIIPKGTKTIHLTNSDFAIGEVQSLRYSIRFDTTDKLYNRETYYDVVSATGGSNRYTVELAKGLDEDIPVESTAANFFHYAHVSDIVSSNQAFVLDTDIGEIDETDPNPPIDPSELQLQLSDSVVAIPEVEPENAFSESIALATYLEKYQVSGSAEVIAFENNLIYVNANETPFVFAIKDEYITGYKYYTSTNDVSPNFTYNVGDFVRYKGTLYECIRTHIPQVQLNTIYFRAPVLDRIPDNARIGLTLTRRGQTLGKFYVKTMSPFNNSAGFRISEIKNSENLKVITDRVKTMFNTKVNASNYPLSGSGVNVSSVNLNTKLKDAFEPVDLTIGEMADIEILNNGSNFENDIKTVVRQNFMYNRGQKDVIISFENDVEIWDSTTFSQVDERTFELKSVTKDTLTITFNDQIDAEVTIDLSNPDELREELSQWVNAKDENDFEKSDLTARVLSANDRQLAVLSMKRQLDESEISQLISPVMSITGSVVDESAADGESATNGLLFTIGSLGDSVVFPSANLEDEVEYPISGKLEDYFNLIPGEVMTQVIEVNDIVYKSSAYKVSLEYIQSFNNKHYFRQKSFYRPRADIYLIHNKRPSVRYNIEHITTDYDSNAVGNNALVDGSVYFARGQLENVDVLNSGFRYRDGEIVKLVNTKTGEVAARAKITVGGTGISEGEWVTFNSFTSDPDAIVYLHDNDYYQEYSYDISSIVSTEEYSSIISDLVQPAGTKQFSTPFINSRNELNFNVDVALEVYDLTEEIIEAQGYDPEGQGIGVVVERDGESVGELVAVIATLDEEAGI